MEPAFIPYFKHINRIMSAEQLITFLNVVKGHMVLQKLTLSACYIKRNSKGMIIFRSDDAIIQLPTYTFVIKSIISQLNAYFRLFILVSTC